MADAPRRQLFVSDLHLEHADDARFITFAHLLRANVDADLFLLGDITEVWVGDDDDAPLATALSALLHELSARTRVFLMHGNRDFLFGDEFAQRTGVTLLADPHVLDASLLLSHGDRYCTDDVAYQNARRTLRSPEWQASILEQSLDARRQFAAGLRAQSKQTNANKAQNIMDVNADAIRAALDASGCQTLIHGHTHRPGRHWHQGRERLVLGDWDHCAWAALSDAGTTSLWRLPLTDRYENETRYRLP